MIRTPAKINLYLHVTGKAPNGYHTLDSLAMFCRDLYDELEIEESDKNEIVLEGPWKDQVVGTNILEKVLKLFAPLLPKVFFKIRVKKNIPVGAGLGGGSSNAGGLIKFLVQRYSLELSESDIIRLSTQIGTDVSMFHWSRPLYFSGIGDIISPVNVPNIWAILLYPNIHMSSEHIYKAGFKFYREEIDRRYDFKDAKDFCKYISFQHNDLFENSVKLAPVLVDIVKEISQLDECLVSRMSGSGSACFGLFVSSEAARNASKALQLKFPSYYICVTQLV